MQTVAAIYLGVCLCPVRLRDWNSPVITDIAFVTHAAAK